MDMAKKFTSIGKFVPVNRNWSWFKITRVNFSYNVNETNSQDTSEQYALTPDTINPLIKNISVPFRGELLKKVENFEKEMAEGFLKSFSKIIRADLNDGHVLGQKPITFLRQVLALVTFPELLKDIDFPFDSRQRAKDILTDCAGGSVGSYSDSSGLEIVKKHVTMYLEKRDELSSDPSNIIIGNGVDDLMKSLLKLIGGSPYNQKSGLLVPIPDNETIIPILEELDIEPVPYYLDETVDWAVKKTELERAVDEGKKNCCPRGILVINPGNPTGQMLTKISMEEVLRFAFEEKLVVFADEEYQEVVFDEFNEFVSFKKMMKNLGEPYSGVELASFGSCAKGIWGEGGLRGAFCEILNFHPNVKRQIMKLVSVNLCSSVLGQVALSVMALPPKRGDDSYELFCEEKKAIFNSLKYRRTLISNAFEEMKHLYHKDIQGAVYSFPQLKFSTSIQEKAVESNISPDMLYCLELLECTGIVLLPGCAFGQKPGTYHVRTTLLPPVDDVECMVKLLPKFHEEFIRKYESD